jgi:hypothetical protein
MKTSKVTAVGAPSVTGFLLGVFTKGTVWEIDFTCAYCDAKNTVQHDSARDWHKCECCGKNSKLSATGYYDFEAQLINDLFNW